MMHIDTLIRNVCSIKFNFYKSKTADDRYFENCKM